MPSPRQESGGMQKSPEMIWPFPLIAPSQAIGCKRIFSLMAMWVHPRQTSTPGISGGGSPTPGFTGWWRSGLAICLHSDEGCCIACATIQQGTPWHLDGRAKPQRNPCTLLHQLQAWRLPQCRKQVVCPGGLNTGLNALAFDFKELPLWNVATMGEATIDPSMIEVGPLQHEIWGSIEPQPNIAKTLNLYIQGALGWLQQTFPTTSTPVPQHSNPGRKLPSVALGAPPPTEVEDPLCPEGADSSVYKLLATSTQALQHMAMPMPNDIPTTVPISHSLSPPPASKTLTAASVPSIPQSGIHPRADPGALSEEVLQLQREMNAAMGWLLTTRASMDSHQRRLVSNTETALHHNEAKATKRQRPSVQLPSRMQRLCPQSPSGRQRLPVWVTPIPCNNPLVKVCKT